MFVGAVKSVLEQSSLEISWKIFFQTLEIEIEIGAASFNLPLGDYSPDLWLTNEQVSIEIESYDKCATTTEGKSIRYQEAANQSNFPILCIKGFPQANRYSVRLFAPRVKAHMYPKFYWATFAEGEGQKLCLIEGNKHWYMQHYESIDSAQALSTPRRHSELILKALECANLKNRFELGNTGYLVGLQSETIAEI
jgi:hypothetical protein